MLRRRYVVINRWHCHARVRNHRSSFTRTNVLVAQGTAQSFVNSTDGCDRWNFQLYLVKQKSFSIEKAPNNKGDAVPCSLTYNGRKENNKVVEHLSLNGRICVKTQMSFGVLKRKGHTPKIECPEHLNINLQTKTVQSLATDRNSSKVSNFEQFVQNCSPLRSTRYENRCRQYGQTFYVKYHQQITWHPLQ